MSVLSAQIMPEWSTVCSAVILDRYGPAAVDLEGSCRKDQRAGNHNLPGGMTALGLPSLKKRRLRMGEGRVIVFLKYAVDRAGKELFSLVESKINNRFKLQLR